MKKPFFRYARQYIRWYAHWPLHVKVPLMTAVLTVLLAFVISRNVLGRLEDNQERTLGQLAGAYLDGVSAAIQPPLIREDIWETYDALERSSNQYEGLNVKTAVVTLKDNRILAASDPLRFPVSSQLPQTIKNRFSRGNTLGFDENDMLVWARRELIQGGVLTGNLYAEFDLSLLMMERHKALITLIVFNGIFTLVFAAVSYLVVERMMRPFGVLSQHMEQLKSGDLKPIPQSLIDEQGKEFATLFKRFNSAVDAVREREIMAQRLADDEKLALLGKLASGMAHEVNNPLGGLMNAVDTLKKHGGNADVRAQSLGLIERGLRGIRHVVRAVLVTYRGNKGCEKSMQLSNRDIDDLKFLLQHEVLRRQIKMDWQNDLPPSLAVDSAAIRQAVLNVLLNACEATPVGTTVSFKAFVADNTLIFHIKDQGPGLPLAIKTLFITAHPDTVLPDGINGLGSWTAARLIARLGGSFVVRDGAEDVENSPGTVIEVHIPLGRSEIYNDVA